MSVPGAVNEIARILRPCAAKVFAVYSPAHECVHPNVNEAHRQENMINI